MVGGYNPNKVKIHRSYTVEEVAALFDVHKNTVRTWIKKGLPVCDEQRPTLILGRDLKEHLKRSRQNRKRKCGPGELYCLSCKSPRKPAGNMVDYEPASNATGRLIGICSCCERIINRYVSYDTLRKNHGNFDIKFPLVQERIDDRANPLLNSDLDR